MKTLKKLLCAALALSLTLALTACGGQDPAASASGSGEGTVYRIGISQYGEHPSLDNCRTGFLQALEEAGLKEGVDFTVDYQNANFDDATATQIAALEVGIVSRMPMTTEITIPMTKGVMLVAAAINAPSWLISQIKGKET